MQGLANLKFYI